MINFTINDVFTKGWIIRLFREARADISASYEEEEPFIVAKLIIQSMKKMQKAIFFCVGEPDIIQELLLYRINFSNSFYELLFSIQNLIGYWIEKIISFEIIKLSEIMADAKNLFEFLNIFVKYFGINEIPSQLQIFPTEFNLKRVDD